MWMPFERRWRDALVMAALPVSVEPVPEAVWDDFADADTPVWWGFRASIWALTISALAVHGRLFHRLPDHQADALLRRWERSPWSLFRQMTVGLKSVTCLLRFTDVGVRQAVDEAS